MSDPQPNTLSDKDAAKLMNGVCPSCPDGNGEVYSGYGLAGGGMGPYWGCDTCGLFHKVEDTQAQ
jgi:hypothetical protein